MRTPLERFLFSLSPEHTWDGVGREVDETLNSLNLASATVRSATELRAIVVQAWRDFHGRVWGCSLTALDGTDDREWGWCREVLDAVYSTPDGWRTAMDLARTGIRHGTRGVLREFLEKAAERYLSQLIAIGVNQLWSQEPYEGRVAMMTEYLAKYGRLLPPSLSQGSIVDLMVDFPRVLTEHPRMLQRLRRLGRR